jgi:hypothetical protein
MIRDRIFLKTTLGIKRSIKVVCMQLISPKLVSLVTVLMFALLVPVSPASADENLKISFVHNLDGYADIAEDGRTWRFGICTDEAPKYYTLQYRPQSGKKWKTLKGYWNSSDTATGTCSSYPDSPYLVEFSYTESKVADTEYRMRFKKKGWKTSYYGNFRVLASPVDAYVPSPTLDSRYYYRCFNKGCSQGEVLRVFNDGSVQGWWGEYDAGCLSGKLENGYLVIGDDYITYPDFGNFDSTKAKGNYKNLKISTKNPKFKWSKAKKNIDAGKLSTLRSEYQECQISHGW